MMISILAAALAASLAASPAPAAPAQRVCPPEPPEATTPPYDAFVVYFDRGSAAITPAAARILANVAEAYRTLSLCQLEIAAHADRAGSGAYNRALSARRGRAVAAYLRDLGVDAVPRIEARGETRPLVETPDGADEPQNRRAEIIVSRPFAM
jgi:outer membrane protein OmpA-like peptidoglycan-associated protein